ncbi:sorting nexin-21 [Tiliqua scincoides]|uniref:sorting nexin-21 n=1 Tax=Tiliqua scincoides TaxID=71010 RepID=UPI003462D845
MASHLLHRLRHALTGEGDQEGLAGCSLEVDDFPESSELEDDTEGLSTRLSGTLSFTSNEEDGEMEEVQNTPVARPEAGGPLEPGTRGDATNSGEPSSTLAEHRGSNMLTRQLQELWRKSRSSLLPQRLLFEVTSTSVVSERNSKYVLYTVYLIQTGHFDRAPAMIARRYSDFERLHRCLRHHFSSDLASVSFPRKRLRHNFAAKTIAKRSRAFEQFLAHLHSLPEIRRSAEYLEFFFLRDLQGAQQLTCSGKYQEALLAWTNARRLQDKLGACHSGHFLLTLAGLAVCQQELAQFGAAHASCEQALQLLEAQDRHPLLVPFLQTHLHLAWLLGLDKGRAEAWLRDLQEASRAGPQPPSLKELLLKHPLP